MKVAVVGSRGLKNIELEKYLPKETGYACSPLRTTRITKFAQRGK